MEFGVLGSFEIRDADQILLLSGGKRRALAALLAVNVGHVCSLDLLVDALWSDESVPGSAGTVQTYISQLRRRLGFPIETTPAGYVLAVTSEAVDALHFERLVDAARARSDAATRVGLLGQALALWRGPALVEFAGSPWADEHARRWERLRREVVQERVRTRLALGEHAALITELELLVEQFPFDEQLTADLMLARYRNGRQAEALREYARLRRRLADELGIDPSAELVDLERRLLDQDPTLDFSAATDGRAAQAAAAVAPLPEGVVTFLLTDIEGSTELWDRRADDMADALAQHEHVIEAVVVAHHGRLLKARGEGDATLSVFRAATDAVAAAVAMQRALGDAIWPGGLALPTRVAVHTGEAQLRAGDYFGGTLNRAARIRTLAAGDSILVSRATHDLVVDTLPEDIALVELGAYQLRGLHRDEIVFAVSAPGVVRVTPGDDATHGSELGPANVFVGRTEILDRLAEALAISGLITITGPGGIGKTRVMQETVDRARNQFSKITVVVLAGVHDEAGLEGALERAIAPDHTSPFVSVTTDGFPDLVAKLVRGLQGRHLLVLDNCEQIREPLAAILDLLVPRCPQLAIVATSRERLNTVAERIVNLAPLDVPARATEGDLDQLASVASMQLLRSRLREAGAQLDTGRKTATQLAEICRQLDGIPLALELAAARLVTTSPGDLLARMSRQLRLLAGDERDPRHRTLYQAIEWSYALLDVAQQCLLRRLGIFVGGFTLDAAEYVCADTNLSADDIYPALCEIVAKSLVLFDSHVGRYRLLEPIRMFAFEHLDEAGEHEAVARQHAQWAQRAARDALRAQVSGTGTPDAFSAELDNIFAALDWSIQSGDDATVLRIVGASGYTWHSTDWRRGRLWTERALELSGSASPRQRAAVLLSRGIVEQRADLEASSSWLEDSRSLFVKIGDNAALGWATFFLARAWTISDRSKRHALLHEARRLFRDSDQPVGEAWALVNLGSNSNFMGDLEGARTNLEAALDLAAVVGDTSMLGVVLEDLGRNALLRGDIRAAQDLFRKAVETLRSSGDRFNLASLLHDAAWTELVGGDEDAAEALAREGIGLSIDIDNEWELRAGLLVLAVIHLRRGDPAQAVKLANATGIRNALASDRTWQRNWLAERAIDVLRDALGAFWEANWTPTSTDLFDIARNEARSSGFTQP